MKKKKYDKIVKKMITFSVMVMFTLSLVNYVNGINNDPYVVYGSASLTANPYSASYSNTANVSLRADIMVDLNIYRNGELLDNKICVAYDAWNLTISGNTNFNYSMHGYWESDAIYSGIFPSDVKKSYYISRTDEY